MISPCLALLETDAAQGLPILAPAVRDSDIRFGLAFFLIKSRKSSSTMMTSKMPVRPR